MLIDALAQRFRSYFDRSHHHDTVLWFDFGQEYQALLDHLTGVPLWRYDGSLLALRYRLILRPAGEKTVVYLPLRQEDAEVLRPFFATSDIFKDRLYRFLRQQGLDFPDDPQVAHELRALLPRLATRSVGKGRAFWEYNLANLERARETLLGNFDDALLRFLERPVAEMQALRAEQLDGLFCAQLESAYGLAADPAGDPDELAGRLATQLALVRAYVAADQPAVFPFASRLPEALVFERNEALLARWQRDSRHKAAYVRLANGLESQVTLSQWAAGLPQAQGLALGATFANVEQALWRAVEREIDGLESEAQWLDWLLPRRPLLAGRAASFWPQEGRAPGWGLLVQSAHLLQAIQAARQELDSVATAAALLHRYALAWWRLDHDFRRLREQLDAQSISLDHLRDRCARSYRAILGQMNERFCTLLDAERSWPAAALPSQDRFWSEVMQPRPAGKRVALLVVDALRYELAQELLAALEADGAGDQRHLAPRLAAIPTVTPIGMTALLPGSDRRQVDYADDWRIAIDGSGNLKDKAARLAWLRQKEPDTVVYNLDELLNTPSGRLTRAPLTVVFETSLDAVGETASQQAWNTFSTLLLSVKKGVHKLLGLGVTTVHIVADHGFLLLDEVRDHEKVSVRRVPALAKKSRYVIGHQLGHTDQLAFPVAGSDDLVAWYPRGVGCFSTPGAYNYVHGGLSLQELVVPHLTVTQRSQGGSPVGIQATLPERIVTAQFRVLLTPLPASTLDQPRQVTVALLRDDQPLLPASSVAITPAAQVSLDILLPWDCGLMRGDRLRWRVQDAASGETLAEQEAISDVEL